MKGFIRTLLASLLLIVTARVSPAQITNSAAKPIDTPAISGYEQELSKELVREWREFSPKSDNVGNVCGPRREECRGSTHGRSGCAGSDCAANELDGDRKKRRGRIGRVDPFGHRGADAVDSGDEVIEGERDD